MEFQRRLYATRQTRQHQTPLVTTGFAASGLTTNEVANTNPLEELTPRHGLLGLQQTTTNPLVNRQEHVPEVQEEVQPEVQEEVGTELSQSSQVTTGGDQDGGDKQDGDGGDKDNKDEQLVAEEPQGPSPEQVEQNQQLAHLARQQNAERNAKLAQLVDGVTQDGHVMHTFNRIVLGSSVTAAINASTLPGMQGGDLGSLPDIIGISKGPSFWETASMPTGQPPQEFESQAWTKSPSQFTTDQQGFTHSNALSDAIHVTLQTAGMTMFDGATVTDVSVTRDETWKQAGNVRITVDRGGKIYHFYAQSTDIATGPGQDRKLEPGNINADEQTALAYRDTLESDGRLQSGQQHIANTIPAKKVLVSGGGATGAWNCKKAANLGAEVHWIARPGKEVPKIGNLPTQAEQIENELATQPDEQRTKELLAQLAQLKSFGPAMLPRNTGEEGAFQDPRIQRYIKQIKGVTPSEKMENAPGDKLSFVEFDDGSSDWYEQIVLSHGPDPTLAGGAADLASKAGIELELVMNGEDVVALQSLDGSVRLIGAAMWNMAYVPMIADAGEQAVYRESMRKQAQTLPPNSKGVAPSVAMILKTVPKANEELAKSQK